QTMRPSNAASAPPASAPMSCMRARSFGAGPATVTSVAAFLTTRSALGKRADPGTGDTAYAERLVAPALAAQDLQGRGGNFERLGQEPQQRAVRRAFDGLGLQAHQQVAVAHAGELVTLGARLYADGKADPAVRLAQLQPSTPKRPRAAS